MVSQDSRNSRRTTTAPVVPIVPPAERYLGSGSHGRRRTVETPVSVNLTYLHQPTQTAAGLHVPWPALFRSP